MSELFKCAAVNVGVFFVSSRGQLSMKIGLLRVSSCCGYYNDCKQMAMFQRGISISDVGL
jgi:hypothetical protein